MSLKTLFWTSLFFLVIGLPVHAEQNAAPVKNASTSGHKAPIAGSGAKLNSALPSELKAPICNNPDDQVFDYEYVDHVEGPGNKEVWGKIKFSVKQPKQKPFDKLSLEIAVEKTPNALQLEFNAIAAVRTILEERVKGKEFFEVLGDPKPFTLYGEDGKVIEQPYVETDSGLIEPTKVTSAKQSFDYKPEEGSNLGSDLHLFMAFGSGRAAADSKQVMAKIGFKTIRCFDQSNNAWRVIAAGKPDFEQRIDIRKKVMAGTPVNDTYLVRNPRPNKPDLAVMLVDFSAKHAKSKLSDDKLREELKQVVTTWAAAHKVPVDNEITDTIFQLAKELIQTRQLGRR